MMRTSRDEGRTWGPPKQLSPDNLLAIWTHNPGAKTRNPLTAAVSKDEGQTWRELRNLEDAPGDAWAYPAVSWVGDRALITYFNYRGGLSLKLRSLPASWFYHPSSEHKS